MGYIPQNALENLKKYSYKGVDNSILSHLILNKYWAWIVNFWPLWVAPNTITFSGLLIVLFNFFTLLYYDPLYLTEKLGGTGPPNWIYFTWAVGLFAYQSFDAVDGKQARRTGMAGPLGQLFDHGCDALNTTLEVVLCCYALNLGRSWWTVSSQIATLANFYLTTWEEYHTGVLFLSAFSGPVEGIILIVIIYFITGFTGPTFWDRGVFSTIGLDNLPLLSKLPDVPINQSFMIFGAIGLGLNVVNGLVNVRRATRAHPDAHSSSPIVLLIPFIFPTLVQVLWLSHPRYHDSWLINSPAFVPFLCAWGLQFSHQVGRMILAHVTGMPFPMWDWVWVWSILGAVDANLPWLTKGWVQAPLVQTSAARTTLVVWAVLAVSAGVYGRFVVLVIRDITEYLGVACFRVSRRDEKGNWRNPHSSEKLQ